MIKTIIYFSRKERITNSQCLGIDETTIALPLTGEIEILTFKNGENKVLVVYDQHNVTGDKKQNFIKSIWDKIKDDIGEFGFIYHATAPDGEIINFLKEKTKYHLKGSHEKGIEGFKYYEPLKDIIENELTKEKFEKIVEFFLKTNNLDQSLDLLHRIYNGEIIKPDTLSDELKDLFVNHYNVTQPYKDEYEGELIALRDAIIKL